MSKNDFINRTQFMELLGKLLMLFIVNLRPDYLSYSKYL